MNYNDMVAKIKKYEKLEASIEVKKRIVSNLKACRYSPYDHVSLSFGGNVGTNQYGLGIEAIDILIEKYYEDIEKLVAEKADMGMEEEE